MKSSIRPNIIRRDCKHSIKEHVSLQLPNICSEADPADPQLQRPHAAPCQISCGFWSSFHNALSRARHVVVNPIYCIWGVGRASQNGACMLYIEKHTVSCYTTWSCFIKVGVFPTCWKPRKQTFNERHVELLNNGQFVYFSQQTMQHFDRFCVCLLHKKVFWASECTLWRAYTL